MLNQICQNEWCKQQFDVTDEDLEFFTQVCPPIKGKKEVIPPPTFCPSCRYQQRLVWRNERNLYKNMCAATGKSLVSVFSPDKAWPPVYDQTYWWGDSWDARSYGKDFDFSRPFFEQWAELFRSVPQIALNNQESENCEFTNQSQRNKDCYLIFCSDESRNCIHGMWNQFCVDCVDCVYLEKGELCYEVLNGKNCYSCTHSINLENCSDVHFSKNCIGCTSCIGCVNLRNKQYCIENQQRTKEEYEAYVKDLGGKYSAFQKEWQKAQERFQEYPNKYYEGSNIFDSSGDYLMNLQNANDCYNCRNDERVNHSQDVWWARNCQDLTETVQNDFSYFVEGSAFSMNVVFSKKFHQLSDAFYCSHCNYSKNLFGCISLNHGEYCILNKQYDKEQYDDLVLKIIDHMKKTGEWGHHFPGQHSPFGYNESVAQEYFPLTKEDSGKRGWKWTEYEAPLQDMKRTIEAKELPDSIEDTTDEILNWAIACESSGKLFRIIKQELDFYRKTKQPIPHLHPDIRYENRMALRNPRKIWNRNCRKCNADVRTSYAPDRPEIVYCEKCYLETVY